MKRQLIGALLGMLAMDAMAADACMENFSAAGNFLTGKTYKTWALLPGVRQDDAFARAYAFTVSNGFTVISSNKEAGVISAQQSVSYGKGKTVPLGIVLQPENGTLRIAINYATSGGTMSPEDAIKKHFCLTIAAAAENATAAPTASSAASPPAPRPPAVRGFATPTEAQQSALLQEIPKNVAIDKLRPQVTQAAPAIAAFVGQLACMADYNGGTALNAHAAPGVDLYGRYVSLRPMARAKYHDKAACMSVSRVHGWKAPANNALQFEVVYKADDSGEISKLMHEAVRQSDGTWLFTQ